MPWMDKGLDVKTMLCSSLTPPPQAEQRGRRIYIYIYSYRVFFTNYPCFSIRAAYVQEASKDPSPGDGFLVAFPWLYLLS